MPGPVLLILAVLLAACGIVLMERGADPETDGRQFASGLACVVVAIVAGACVLLLN